MLQRNNWLGISGNAKPCMRVLSSSCFTTTATANAAAATTAATTTTTTTTTTGRKHTHAWLRVA